MNRYQDAWWQQARSDRDVLVHLRRQGIAHCHQLHYVQMVTEKLGKAYFWRSGTPPPKSHAAFVQFMRSLGSIQGPKKRKQVAEVLGFGRYQNLQKWIREVLPLAYELERLAPTLARDGPSPEYPWPAAAPKFVPANFTFDLWNELTNTGRGRQLLQVINVAIDRFLVYEALF